MDANRIFPEDSEHPFDSRQTADIWQDILDPSMQLTAMSHFLNLQPHNMELDPTLERVIMTPSSSGEHFLKLPGSDGISNEQLEQVQRLWPTRRRRNVLLPSCINWDEVLLHPEDNIFSSTSLRNLTSTALAENDQSAWGFNMQCRNRLLHQMNIYVSGPTSSLADEESDLSSVLGPRDGDSELPPADILDLSLDLYFSHVHIHLPFVHPPTFNSSHTPSILLFPMCMAGFMFFNRKAANTLFKTYLPVGLALPFS